MKKIPLRHILAGMAMQGMYANQEMLSALKRKGTEGEDIQDIVALAAVCSADALLERLEPSPFKKESDGA